ncbi:hypothetical protein F53441_12595 [Fusarium austroafricanum]|uniref:Uncharacterized protein n=1 Tax=Fusarium austroafricanum TaxID=2364996 RepID=A0A8H4NNI9_9HYPO|nr:hypothetical protein F53441_12595 [Fusarium austroafricanum]
MRYEDWDVLLFEENSIIPLREFRVECHAVRHMPGPGLPTLTCFVPSLNAGAPFRVSLHSWKASSVDQLNHSSPIKTELLIDGRLVASSSSPGTCWPHIIEKESGKGSLMFPAFEREFLYQIPWSPADNLGRIKLIVTGNPGNKPSDTLNIPFSSTVVFSFQHAPQELLELHQLAWPNRSMWADTPVLTPNHRFDIQTGRYQSFSAFPGQEVSEYNGNTPSATLSFNGSNNSTPGYPNTPMNATILPWGDAFAPPPSVIDSPCFSIRKPQSRKESHSHFQAWPTFPMFTDPAFGVDHQTQRRASQQMYTQPNSSTTMSLVQPQLQSPAVYGSTELGRGTPAGNSVRLVLAPNHNSSQESFDLDVVERAAKRARPNTPESAETLSGDGPQHWSPKVKSIFGRRSAKEIQDLAEYHA